MCTRQHRCPHSLRLMFQLVKTETDQERKLLPLALNTDYLTSDFKILDAILTYIGIPKELGRDWYVDQCIHISDCQDEERAKEMIVSFIQECFEIAREIEDAK